MSVITILGAGVMGSSMCMPLVDNGMHMEEPMTPAPKMAITLIE